MRPLINTAAILHEIDAAIANIGMIAYYNQIYGTTNSVDMVYVHTLERARRMLLNRSTGETANYVRHLLISSYNGQ
jgi:hypothetical protein